MNIEIGKTVRELRRRDGRTQDDLAQALGVSPQAVSRWEQGGAYPDMELIPSIANYFGVSIDELFGYENDREKKVDETVKRLRDMNFKNNGVDINITECIAAAREALIEFPGNEKITLCLASILYNAGYVRYGEYHLTDEEGFDVYDAELHRTYAEWREAIKLYEKLLETIKPGETRGQVIRELTQLYLNTGEHERAKEVIKELPHLYESYEFLRINASDGKERAVAYGDALIQVVCHSAGLIVGTVIAYNENMTYSDKANSIENAIKLFDLVFTDGNCGHHSYYIARIYTLLSVYLWLADKHDEAFDALNKSLEQFKAYEKCCDEKPDSAYYTAPLLKYTELEKIQATPNSEYPHTSAYSLVEDWPWWSVPEYDTVKPQIQADPRWEAWIKACRES